MKLRNKKTGEIGNLQPYGDDGRIWVWTGNMSKPEYRYKSLAKLKAEWEDYEEPKEYYWYIDDLGVVSIDKVQSSTITVRKNFGNYFETKEEAERAIEKLKAWKRLKDKGFKLDAVVDSFFCLDTYMKDKPYEEIKEDLKIVFGGEE